ncbi:MAG: hypothetical protein ACI4S2_12355 [Lachnospiraceae bacterium]
MSETLRNTIELNIYDDELEIVKTYKSYGIRWKSFKKIVSMGDDLDKISDSPDEESINVINEVLRLVFPKITDNDLDEAYYEDLYFCFKQAINTANNMAKNS